MTYLNLHNNTPGTPRYTSANVSAIPGLELSPRWETIVAAMDDTIREQVHGELFDPTCRAFLARYLELATHPLIIG